MTTIWNLFFTFFKIGLLSIGGGYAIIPLIQEQVVNQAGWISEKLFTDIITISQMTPGPLAVNTSTFVGLQIGGIGRSSRYSRLCNMRSSYLFIFIPLFSKAPEFYLYL